MINAIFRPFENPPKRSRKEDRFKSSWSKTLDILEKEINHLGGHDVIIQAGFTLEQIRNDGWPRGSAKPWHPAIVLIFVNRRGNSLSFPCDTYDCYDANLHAIALSLKALRDVDRYGVTKGSEQYQGFAALPPKSDGRGAAIAFVATVTGWPESQVKSDPQGAYRLAARACHPDAGGSTAKFHELQKHWVEMNA